MKKFICVFLALSILICVFGGILFQPAKAVVATSTVVVGAAVAFLAMCGITWVVTGMTVAQFTAYVSDMLDEWALSQNDVVDHLINTAGIGVTIPGLLKLSNEVSNALKSFTTWFINRTGIQAGSYVNVVEQPATIGGCNATRVYQLAFRNGSDGYSSVYTISQGIVYGVYNMGNNDGAIYLISTSEFVVVQVNYWGDGTVASTYTHTGVRGNNGVYNKLIYWNNRYNDPPPLASVNMSTNDFNNMIWNLQPTFQEMKQLTVVGDVINLPTIGTDDNTYIDVGALPGDDVIEVTNKVIEDAVIGDQVVEGDIAEDDPQITITGPVAVTGLDEVFPFCIPFDIYNLLRVLAAPPETPVFEWRFWIPHVCDETIEIDLSGFDTLAALLRTFEVGLFCLGLALMTKRLIWK